MRISDWSSDVCSSDLSNSANLVVAQLLFLESENPDKDISLYINSPGGSVYAGMAIYDTMQFIKPDVSTLCTGIAPSIRRSRPQIGRASCRERVCQYV